MGLLIAKGDNIENPRTTKEHIEHTASIGPDNKFLLLGDNIIHKHSESK